MKRGHVFIVNEQTLPIHLEYEFVGVSSGDKDNNIGLLSDIKRVKRDDLVFFYIEGNQTKKGRFFGIFQITDDTVYHVVGGSAKNPNLPVKLIYRKKIKPYQVFGKGVLEWTVLDKLPTFSKELFWSLIYRKMKGGRGNTMLLPWETERLVSLIKNENSNIKLNYNYFSFDKNKYQIVPAIKNSNYTLGNPTLISTNDIKKSETHFQAYIMEKISIGNNLFYPQIFGKNIVWLGNEVFAGSGMQKIDILSIEKIADSDYIYRIIELKHPKSSTNINFAPYQLEYYINWAREDIGGHILGAQKFNIKPILLSLVQKFNSTPISIISQIKQLNLISNQPEIWEIDYMGNTLKIL